MTNVLQESIQDYIVHLRNQLTDPQGRGSSKTDTWPNASNQGTFTLTETSVKNVSGVSVDGNSKSLRTDYTVEYNPAGSSDKVIMDSPVTGSVDITYSYGKTWIYPEFPRLKDVTLPRVSVIRIGPSEDDRYIGESNIIYSQTFQTDVWVDRSTECTINGVNYSGASLRDYIGDQILDAVRGNGRDWIPNQYYMRIASIENTTEEVKRKGKTIRHLYRGRYDVEMNYLWSS